MRFTVMPGGRLQGRLRVPGDKSISHRALMLAAVADGETAISGLLEGADTLATLRALQAMGVAIEGPTAGKVRVHGAGMRGLKSPTGPLDLGNSGTSMRLLAGLLAGQGFDVVLTGDASLSRRPMTRVADPLRRMGVRIELSPHGTAPLSIRSAPQLHGVDYEMPVASAQVKSCLLLAGLYAEGRTCVAEPAPTRDHTERMLRAFGYPIAQQGSRVCVTGGGRLRATSIDVPADLSSAAFFMVGASIAPGSSIVLEGVGINPTRSGIVDVLRAMGADIVSMNRRLAGDEPVADIQVRSAALKGIRIGPDQVALAIDEFPALFVAAACAEGETVVEGAGELRVKESDRIQVMAEGLQRLGVEARPTADGMVIRGTSAWRGGEVDSQSDHRIAMAFSIAALRARDIVEISDCANVVTSYPNFPSAARSLGLKVTEELA